VISPSGEPTLTTKFLAPPDGNWPHVDSVDRVAFSFTTTGSSGPAQHSIAVYLRRDRFLLALYFPRPDGAQSAIQGQSTVRGIVDQFAKRLARASFPLRLS
jgi:hypothetical protein